jgi:hypothetical protein
MRNCASENLEIPGSREDALPGMTENCYASYAAIFCNSAISASGAVTAGEWLASIS